MERFADLDLGHMGCKWPTWDLNPCHLPPDSLLLNHSPLLPPLGALPSPVFPPLLSPSIPFVLGMKPKISHLAQKACMIWLFLLLSAAAAQGLTPAQASGSFLPQGLPMHRPHFPPHFGG